MTLKQKAKHIQTILGLDANIEFKVHKKPFKYRGKLVVGLTHTYTDGTFLVEFTNDSDVIHTILHELAHVDGNIRGDGKACDECDQFADDVLEYVKEQLGY